jgi:hypothetical protein
MKLVVTYRQNIGFAAAAFLMFTHSISLAMATSFFIDNGQTDVVDGIPFEIVPPHLFIKKAFNLRDEQLTPAQLLIIREAMPAIASMTHQVLTRATNTEVAFQNLPQPRSIYQIQHIEGPAQLYIQTIKNWLVTETSIQFSSDYFYRQNREQIVSFRDTYLFSKTKQAWHFLKHPNSKPDGVLLCAKSESGWMRCELPVKP